MDRTIDTDPEAAWRFVTNQLDTHRAATRVIASDVRIPFTADSY